MSASLWGVGSTFASAVDVRNVSSLRASGGIDKIDDPTSTTSAVCLSSVEGPSVRTRVCRIAGGEVRKQCLPAARWHGVHQDCDFWPVPRQCPLASLHSPNQSVLEDRHQSSAEALPRA